MTDVRCFFRFNEALKNGQGIVVVAYTSKPSKSDIFDSKTSF